MFVAAQLTGIDAGRALDTTAVAIPFAGALARLGCFAAQCCVGTETRLWIGVVDDAGIRRHPTQLYEAAVDVAIAVWFARSKRRRIDGHRFLLSLAAMCVGRFAVEFVRESGRIGPLSLAQWIVGPTAILCVAIVSLELRIPQFRRQLSIAATSMTALLLQMPTITPDTTYPRTYYSIGGGALRGAYDHVTTVRSCDNSEVDSWVRHHSYFGGVLEGGMRREQSRTRALGVRAGAVFESHNAGNAMLRQGSLGPDSGSYSRSTIGLSIVGDLDWKYLGLSLGGTVGDLYVRAGSGYADNELGRERALPAIGLRIGTNAGALEARFGNELPTFLPGPVVTLGIMSGDDKGNRIRVGASEIGPFATGRIMTSSGLEFDPFVSVSLGQCSNCEIGRNAHAGVLVRKWFRSPSKAQ